MFKLRYLLLLLFLSFAVKQTTAQELRTGAKIAYGFMKKAEIELSYQKRFFYDRNIESIADILKVELGYSLYKRVSVGASYRTKFQEGEGNTLSDFDINDNQRVTADIYYKPKLGNDFKLKSRFRYQYSLFDEEDEEGYLRERILLEKKISDYFVPFVGYEFYYQVELNEMSTTRFYLGNEAAISKKISAEAFLIKEKKKEKKRSEYMIGISLKYKI